MDQKEEAQNEDLQRLTEVLRKRQRRSLTLRTETDDKKCGEHWTQLL